MNLHLTSQSENYEVDINENTTILKWRVHMDLSSFKFISLRDFRVRPGHLLEPKNFSFISCNLVKNDVLNPLGVIHCTTSFNHAISNPGLSLSLFG